MNYENLIKKIDIPADFQVPLELKYEDLISRPLSRKDLDDDVQGVNSSLEVIRNTRGGTWPAEPVTEDFDLLDLAWHEREFRDENSFAYVVYDTSNNYIGCFYLYGMGCRTPLTEDLLEYQVDASWWVTADAYDQGYYQKLQTALNNWLVNDFYFTNIYYSNKEQ